MNNKFTRALLYTDSHDSIVRVLQSWRLWVVGAILGAVLASGIYLLFPPAYRAAAVVVVDHNLEEVWDVKPNNTFYFLGRETRKLEELAWSDATLQLVVDEVGDVSIRELRDEILFLSNPSDGGWDFYASDRDPKRAEQIASAWAHAFVDQVHANIEISAELIRVREEINEFVLENNNLSDNDFRKLIDKISPSYDKTVGITPYIETYVSQSEQLSVERNVSMAVYIISGSAIGALGLAFSALVLLRAEERDEFLVD